MINVKAVLFLFLMCIVFTSACEGNFSGREALGSAQRTPAKTLLALGYHYYIYKDKDELRPGSFGLDCASGPKGVVCWKPFDGLYYAASPIKIDEIVKIPEVLGPVALSTNCAVGESGKVTCWLNDGQPALVPDEAQGSNVTQVSSDYFNGNCVLKDKTPICWRVETSWKTGWWEAACFLNKEQPCIPRLTSQKLTRYRTPTLGAVSEVAVYIDETCAIEGKQGVVCWKNEPSTGEVVSVRTKKFAGGHEMRGLGISAKSGYREYNQSPTIVSLQVGPYFVYWSNDEDGEYTEAMGGKTILTHDHRCPLFKESSEEARSCGSAITGPMFSYPDRAWYECGIFPSGTDHRIQCRAAMGNFSGKSFAYSYGDFSSALPYSHKVEFSSKFYEHTGLVK